MSGFQPLVRHVSDGEPVSAATTNRAPMTLESNIRWLKDVIDAAGVGRTLIDRDVSVSPSVQVGMPVYLNRTTGLCEPALAAVQTDPATGALYAADSACVWGIAIRKTGVNTADLLLHGVANVDLSAVVSGDPTGRILYLSGTVPGCLTAQRPPLSLPLALAGNAVGDGVWRLLVRIDLRDILEAHKHYCVTLQTAPAGDVTPPEFGAPHAITNPNSDIEGWLPADHEIFNSKAPEGAKFGYNLSQASWGALWPPIPARHCYIEWDFTETPVSLSASAPVGLGQFIITDENGIWWMTDEYGCVPWSTDLDTVTEVSASEISESEDAEEEIQPALKLWFTKPVFTSTGSAVLSLQARAGSNLQVYCRGTNTPARTGHLDLNFALNLDSGETGLAGFRAFKRYRNGQLDAGPVVEGVKAGTTNVVINGVSGESAIDSQGFVAGKVSISVTNMFSGVEIPTETVHLAGAYDAFPFGVVALAFDPGKTASIAGRLTLPTQPTLPEGTLMKIRLIVFCREAGNLPAEVLTGTYRRLARPAAVLTPVAMPTVDTNLGFNTAVTVSTNTYVTIESEPFVVTTGDIVMFTVRRLSSDSYPGILYLVRKCGVLAEVNHGP